MLPRSALAVALAAAAVWPLPAQSQEGRRPHAGMLRYPDVSGSHVVFMYANDLWIVPREGGTASPLSSPPGQEVMPRFSPDGRTIAFAGNYDGNRDIYTLPLEGGVPTRITHHPASEKLCDWTADGRILFATNATTGLARQDHLYLVSSRGGLPTRVPVPYGTNGAVDPTGRWIAYTPHSTDFATWKRYRGGMATDIWLFGLVDHKSRRITDWEGTDTLPMWHGAKVYYLSDAGPEHRLNLWVFDTASGRRTQVTRFSDYDVKWPAIGPGPEGKGEIVFQHGSRLRLLDLASGKSREVEVRIPGDRPTLRGRAVDASRFIYAWGGSPTGKRAAVEARGEIWTAPAKNGTPRNLTRSSGSAERDPAWSPDGRWIAYFSDATGEYELYVVQSDGKGQPRQLTKDGGPFKFRPIWSPDSQKILYSDKTGSLYLISADGGAAKLIDRDPQTFRIAASWSHDSRWIAYGKNDARTDMSSIWIYSVETGEKRQVTSGRHNENSPVFDRAGDYLFFASSRAFQPLYEDLGTTWVYTGTEVLLAVPLRADMASPYLPKSDEETFKSGEEGRRTTVDDGRFAAARREAAEAALATPPSPIGQTPATQVTPQADEVSGTWTGTAAGEGLPGGSIPLKMVLTLGAGNAVRGTVETPIGNGTLAGTFNPATKEMTATASIEGGHEVAIAGRFMGSTFTGTGTANGVTAQLKLERQGGAASRPVPQAGQPPASGSDAGKPRDKVAIDFEGFEARAIQLPVRRGNFANLAVNDRGQLFYARVPSQGSDDQPSIRLFDLKDEKREEKTVATGSSSFQISADGKKLLVIRGMGATIQDAAPGATGEAVVTAGMTASVDPRAEWRQMFLDAWRIERDFFYDPNMHGVDWKAVREQYGRMLEDAVNREDVSYVISEMIAELNVGHAYYFGGDVQAQPSVSVGLLGADLELNDGAFRIARIYRGGPWDSDARGPLDQPGMKVKEGDYLLAVNGVPIDTTKDPWAAFQGMAEQTVTLTVSSRPKPDSDAREVVVKLLAADGHLRYREWIERNRAHVEKQTGGRVGYIYVPDTGINGQNDLVRQFVGQRGKDALIIDERWNGGGQIPTRFIELLNRPLTNYWARRDHADWAWPPDAHFGPKVMLINGLAGSGGDAFPWYFRQAGLGKLVGTRTWGGLIGISGYPPLVDGATVTAPSFAFYEKDGSWGVEGHGVDPDIEVLDDPALMVNGRDPQLDTAIKVVMDELKRNPPPAPKRPPYPNRRGFGLDPKDR